MKKVWVWGVEILKLRAKMNITRAQLANELGVNERTIGRWENGEVIPSLKNQDLIDDLKIKLRRQGFRVR